ncbi:hypothetical protein BGZ70_001879 [Mortierella alpina]|uniref:Ricin B lectin domain-containing protein n=1 Tax=Mortierella alpina TaxID=64518 RepID=A0A9P6LWK0_MORAP|nr:hypothetical protein BGZ70_001879 [Mortierella alpina]
MLMRHAATLLLAIIAIIHAVLAAAPLLPNGNYRIYNGNSHHPPSNRYFTGKPDARAGSVSLEPNSTSPMQVWKLRNHSSGRVSLQLVGSKERRYLSEGRSGALPGAHVGVTEKQQKWNIVKVAGGSFTRYTLSFPRKVFNKTLVVSTSTGSLKRVAFQNEDNPDVTKAWKFARYNN